MLKTAEKVAENSPRARSPLFILTLFLFYGGRRVFQYRGWE
jgi:hypothetical protein